MTLEIETGGVQLSTPILPASGTFGWGTELKNLVDYSALGAVVTKGISLHPRKGNPQPRLLEVPCGLINSIGLQNPGVDAFIQNYEKELSALSMPVIVNIFGESPQEYAEVATKLSNCHWVSGLEINLSCPNVHAGGLEFGSNITGVRDVIQAVRNSTNKPLWAKFSHSTHLFHLVEAALEAGSNAVVLLNTLPALAINIKSKQPVLGARRGGLSGPPLKYVALRDVFDVYSRFKCHIVGVGGIIKPEDAVEFILAGARAVEIGTGAMVHPELFIKCRNFMSEYLKNGSYESVENMVGLAHDDQHV